MGLNTAASISFSQINSTSYFTNGNLGINTTNPTANLDVAGTIKASGLSSLASITTGALSATNVVGNSISAGTLSATTITGANMSLSGNLSVAGTLTTVNITSTNMLNTNISAGTINATGLSSLQNVTATNVSAGIVIASTGVTTGTISVSGLSALANVTATNVSTGVVIASTGVTTGTISASGLSTLTNVTATNVSTGVVIASTGVTTGTISVSGTSVLANVVSTNVSTGGLNASGLSALANVTATNVSTGVVIASTGVTTGTISASGLSTLTNVIATNVSTGVVIASTGVTTGTISASGLSTLTNVIATNVSTGVVIASTGVTTGTINASGLSALANVTATNVSAGIVIASTGITTGTINATGLSVLANATATNISTGTIIATGLSSLQNVTLTNISAATIQVSGTNDTQHVPSCVFANNSTVGGTAVASFLTPNMPTPSISYSYFGKSLSSGNSSSISYNYVGSDNSSNYISLNNYGKAGGIYLLNNGNVGIGTDTPLSSLHVSGTMPIAPSGNGVFMGVDTSNNYGIQLNSGSNGSANSEYIDFGYNGIDYVSRILSANTDRSLSFYVNSNVSASMTIQSTGNVSIPTLTSTNSVVTNVSTGTLIATTSVTSGLLSATNIVGTSISAGTLSATTITGANLSLSGNLSVAGTLTTVNITSTNMLNTNISAGTINATSLSSLQNVTATNISTGTLRATGISTLANVTATGSGSGTNGAVLITGSDNYGHSLYVGTEGKRIGFNNAGSGGNIFAYDYGGNVPQNLTLQGPGGNVGIGAATPTVPLTFSDTLGDKISLYSSNTTANFGFGIQASLLQIHGGTITDDIAFGYGASSYFTERMRIKGSGNVGIGTNSPSTRLHVSNNSGNTMTLQNTTNNDNACLELTTNSFTTYIGLGNPASIFSNNTFIQCAKSLQILVNNGVTTAMFMNTSGNIGIGTVSPAYTLDISGTARVSSNLFVGNGSGAVNLNLWDIPGASWQVATGDNKLSIGNGTVGGSIVNRITVSSTGNVGIGTVSPAYTLDVAGTGRFTSNLAVMGNVGIGTTSPSGMLHLNNAALFTSTGNLTCTGDVISFGSLSDRRLKKNIETIETAKALDIVSKLRAVSFDWKDDIFNEEKRNTSDLGFIAQEVEELIPEAVSEYTQLESGEVYKNIKHERLVPYLLSAIQYLLSKEA